MKLSGYIVVFLLIAGESAYSQERAIDSTFSLLINGGLSFTHADDPRINRWLQKYGYPAEPHVPTSLNIEAAAIPADSRLMYSVRLSTITSGNDLTSFSLLAGLHYAVVKTNHFLFFLGMSAGYHADIIALNGSVPSAYQPYEEMAKKDNTSLALRRYGLSIEPAARLLWYPVQIKCLQLGVTGGLGYDIDENSHWRLGYYSDAHGKYDHFKKLEEPNDQYRVTEHGFSINAGLSLRFILH